MTHDPIQWIRRDDLLQIWHDRLREDREWNPDWAGQSGKTLTDRRSVAGKISGANLKKIYSWDRWVNPPKVTSHLDFGGSARIRRHSETRHNMRVQPTPIQPLNTMSSADPRISNCRHCQHYQLQGRRGGLCQKLNVAVRSEWSACSLALPAFANPIDLAPLDLPQVMVATNAVIPKETVLIDTLLGSRTSTEKFEPRPGRSLAIATGESIGE
jgi:hypothetical protein